jgi:hypothetical protein
VFYLSDDPPPARAAPRRVLRLLQLLGMQCPQEPARFPIQNEAETDAPACLATADPPRELDAVVDGPNGYLAMPLDEKTPQALPPLPPLRFSGSAPAPTLPREHHAPDAIAARGEPRSQDAVLEPRSTLVGKAFPAARDDVDQGRTECSVTVAFTGMELPSMERKISSELTSPTVPPQTVATSRRQPNKAGTATPNTTSLPQPVNTLRDRSPVAMTARPKDIPPTAEPMSKPTPTAKLASKPMSKPTPTAELASTPTRSALPEPPSFLTPSPSLDLRGMEPPVAGAEAPQLRVAVREGRLLRTPENIVRVVPEHDRFCDVLMFNPREVAVIGKKQGTVRVELWYDQQGLKRASYLVAVDGQTSSEAPEADLQKIEQLIADLCPASRIKLVREQDRLIVRGLTVNPRQAVEIMSTVRRSQSIPVVDEIVVQPQAN